MTTGDPLCQTKYIQGHIPSRAVLIGHNWPFWVITHFRPKMANYGQLVFLILANFGHKVANSGQPELLAAKIFKSLGSVDVCKEFVTKQNSLRCTVLEI